MNQSCNWSKNKRGSSLLRVVLGRLLICPRSPYQTSSSSAKRRSHVTWPSSSSLGLSPTNTSWLDLTKLFELWIFRQLRLGVPDRAPRASDFPAKHFSERARERTAIKSSGAEHFRMSPQAKADVYPSFILVIETTRDGTFYLLRLNNFV